MTAPAQPTVAPVADLAGQRRQAADYRAGQLAEQRHQVTDLDPDSSCCLPGFACPNCPPGGAA